MQNKIINEINALLKSRDFVLVGIDGRCGAGKTTLAERIKNETECNVIHLDSFFLRPEQRTEERLEEAGGNVDYERFLKEVLIPLSKNEAFSYRPYSCKTHTLGAPEKVMPKRVAVVEGSYACHPKFYGFFDLHIFLDISKEEQIKRITARNGLKAVKTFKEKWIPLEEKYFEECKIKEKCMVLG